MSHFDIRYTIPIFINCLKFISEALPWDFDAFHVLDPNQTSWATISFLVFMLHFFSFTSITIFPTRRRPPNSAIIRFQLETFSPHIAVSLFASLFLPQTLFWFLYPSFLILNHHLLGRVNVRLLALPSWDIRISSTLTYDHHEYDIEAQAPIHPVSAADHFSPEDVVSYSHPEANDENMEALTTASVTGSHYDG